MRLYAKKEPKLCDFTQIKLDVPRYKLIRLLFKRNYLQHEETVFLKALHWEVEAKENQILHVKSIIEKALLKSK